MTQRVVQLKKMAVVASVLPSCSRLGIQTSVFPHQQPFVSGFKRGTSRCRHQIRGGPNDREAAVMEMIEEAKEIMVAIEQTNAQVGPEMPNLSVKSVMDSMEEEDWGTDSRGIICDGDGCVIVPVNLSPEEAAGTRKDVKLYTKTGKGWLLGYDPKGQTGFAAKIGGAGWELSITKEEYREFLNLLQRIRFSVAALGYKGQWYGKSDKPKLEMKSPIVRVQAFPASTAKEAAKEQVIEGNQLPDVPFAIRFVFQTATEREVSGVWAATAVTEALKVLETDKILNLSAESSEDLRTEGAGYAI